MVEVKPLRKVPSDVLEGGPSVRRPGDNGELERTARKVDLVHAEEGSRVATIGKGWSMDG